MAPELPLEVVVVVEAEVTGAGVPVAKLVEAEFGLLDDAEADEPDREPEAVEPAVGLELGVIADVVPLYLVLVVAAADDVDGGTPPVCVPLLVSC
jgi:hypothetical protein